MGIVWLQFIMNLLLLLLSIWNVVITQEHSVKTCEEIITKWTMWDDPSPGLAATLKVPVTEEITSWGVNFNFNKEFTNIDFFNGLSEAHSGHSFNVTNEDWSGTKHPGDLISFSLLEDYEMGEQGEITITDIGLNGNELCSNKAK